MRRFYLRGGGAKGTSYRPGGWICPELHVELDHGVEIPHYVGWRPPEESSLSAVRREMESRSG
jgi:hypothetical protein